MNLTQIEKLADSTETPFYLINVSEIKNKTAHFLKAWKKFFPLSHFAYSFKSNSLKAITELMHEMGLWAEIVSGAELEHALCDGFKNIVFNGPLKLPLELKKAYEADALIQIDCMEEAKAILKTLKTHKPKISIRLSSLYHNSPSRFGVDEETYYVISKKLEQNGIRVQGIHIHVGSNITNPQTYVTNLQRYQSLLKTELEKNDYNFTVDIGGGYPALSALSKAQSLPSIEEFASEISKFFTQSQIDIEKLKLIIEPGRHLVEDNGYLITKIHYSKKFQEKTLLISDAGLPLVRSLGSWHHPIFFSRHSTETEYYDIVGANCFESDYLGRNIVGPKNLLKSDIIIIGSAGGYDIPSANAWIRPLPAIYSLDEKGQVWLIREQQKIMEMRERQVKKHVSC